MSRAKVWVVVVGWLALGAWGMASEGEAAFLRELAAEAEKKGKTVVVGAEGWLFFAPELRSVSVGPFWGEAARKVSRAPQPEHADPLPAILDFHEQLRGAGIELLFVPVPAKALIYPEKLSNAAVAPSLGETYRTFYELLKGKGVAVLDLTPTFLAAKGSVPLYCKQDTHWSPEACVLAANAIAERIRGRPWVESVPKRHLTTKEREVEITGDLWRALGDPSLPKERLRLTVVEENGAPVRPWRESPVLLLGDSHTLVYHAGEDLFGEGGGLADHLARALGFPVDVVGVRGSGATPSRLSLLRRGDNLAGKRLVVWCLSVREFTEGQGWRKVPVIRAGRR